ncbi:hypothetical protein M3P05_13630 [Sansalvadorimonas sp. 2012CJ34-2]|uniref:Uncharacterized protein n=1 Tax=Parendozoicomonas callyspongiae TaxID=2942213 RepID=A0ABT0PI79_9GAMM|nr:hypothetical protein [Sansalvadorimonas sp. 2012CJ34-2]MCL6270966.1 hypothetical protein [Sansalvadorimonas sp. 2012CJ34-2]
MHWFSRAFLFFALFSQFSLADTQKPYYRVAILDRFFPPVEGFSSAEQRDQHLALYGLVDVDDDDQKEPLYHGDLVRLLASNNQFTFITYPIQDNRSPISEILNNLRKINARFASQPIDALVLSWESSTLISNFDSLLETTQAEAYKNKVKEMGKSSEVWRDTYLIITELEKLTSKNVMIYTIAGNGGRNMVNTFSFAEGVVTVGAVESELDSYIANNAFVDTYAQAAYQLVRIDDAYGKPLGYDLNSDRCIDIPLNQLSGFRKTTDYPKTFWKVLKGSSFAAPTALKLELMKNLKTSC